MEKASDPSSTILNHDRRALNPQSSKPSTPASPPRHEPTTQKRDAPTLTPSCARIASAGSTLSSVAMRILPVIPVFEWIFAANSAAESPASTRTDKPAGRHPPRPCLPLQLRKASSAWTGRAGRRHPWGCARGRGKDRSAGAELRRAEPHLQQRAPRRGCWRGRQCALPA